MKDFAFEASERTTEDTDVVVHVEGLGREVDRVVGIVEHETKHFHLVVGNDCQRVTSEVIGDASLVGEEIFDEREIDDVTSFLFGSVDEDEGGDEHSLDLFLLPCTPYTQFVLGGHVGFVAQIFQLLAAGFFGVSSYDCHKPLTAGYAYGIANFESCRHLIDRSRVDIHKLFL